MRPRKNHYHPILSLNQEYRVSFYVLILGEEN